MLFYFILNTNCSKVFLLWRDINPEWNKERKYFWISYVNSWKICLFWQGNIYLAMTKLMQLQEIYGTTNLMVATRQKFNDRILIKMSKIPLYFTLYNSGHWPKWYRRNYKFTRCCYIKWFLEYHQYYQQNNSRKHEEGKRSK